MNTVHCPNCKKTVEWATSPFRPFCSKRCRLIDLGAWADGTYAIPAPLSVEDLETLADQPECGPEEE